MFWSSASRPLCESGLPNSIFSGSDPDHKSFHRILRALVLVVIVGWGMPVNWMRETGEAFALLGVYHGPVPEDTPRIQPSLGIATPPPPGGMP